jgi:hypothetical protein
MRLSNFSVRIKEIITYRLGDSTMGLVLIVVHLHLAIFEKLTVQETLRKSLDMLYVIEDTKSKENLFR